MCTLNADSPLTAEYQKFNVLTILRELCDHGNVKHGVLQSFKLHSMPSVPYVILCSATLAKLEELTQRICKSYANGCIVGY